MLFNHQKSTGRKQAEKMLLSCKKCAKYFHNKGKMTKRAEITAQGVVPRAMEN